MFNTPSKLANKIFIKWRDDLHLRDKKIKNVSNNFNDLFYAMASVDIPVDIAKEFVKPAIMAHLPDGEIVKRTFSALKKRKLPFLTDSRDDFFQGWKKQIEEYANSAFEVCYNHAMPSEEDREYAEYMKRFKEISYEEVKERAQKIKEAIESTDDSDISVILGGSNEIN